MNARTKLEKRFEWVLSIGSLCVLELSQFGLSRIEVLLRNRMGFEHTDVYKSHEDSFDYLDAQITHLILED